MIEEQIPGQIDLFGPDTWSGRMCQEHSAATKAKTSGSSLKRSSKSQSRTPYLCLCLTRENGQNAECSTMRWVDGPLLGDYTMQGFGESPSVVAESHLSQILEVSPQEKYYLSGKACAGILNRANKRGKELPVELETSLQKQIEYWQEHSRSGGGVERDSNGHAAGKGALIQDELSGTLGVSQDQTLFCAVENHPADSRVKFSEDGACQALTGRMGTGGGNVPLVASRGGHSCFALQGNQVDRPETAVCNGAGWKEDESYTLNTIDRHAVAVGYDGYNQSLTGEQSCTLRGTSSDADHVPGVMTYQQCTGPLMANSHPGSYCGQDAYSDMLVTEMRSEDSNDPGEDVPALE